MQLYKYFLLTVTLLVAMAIPGCKNETSVRDLFPQTTSTTPAGAGGSTSTSTTTPVVAFNQNEISKMLAGMQHIMNNASYVTAESYFVAATQIKFITDDFNAINASANLASQFISYYDHYPGNSPYSYENILQQLVQNLIS